MKVNMEINRRVDKVSKFEAVLKCDNLLNMSLEFKKVIQSINNLIEHFLFNSELSCQSCWVNKTRALFPNLRFFIIYSLMKTNIY